MKRRLLLLVLVIVALAFAIHGWHWLMVHLSEETGTSSSASRSYNFFSGFGSDLGEVTLVVGLVTILQHLNCHQPGCWRLGHPTPKGYKLCKKHVALPASDLDLHEIHPDHQ